MKALLYSPTITRIVRIVSIIMAAAILCYLNSCSKDEPVAPASPTVRALLPDHGPEGVVVKISGTGFGNAVSGVGVSFNGTAAVITDVTDSLITTAVPTGATTGVVAVTVAGIAIDAPVFTVTAEAIQIDAIRPTSGKTGTEVVIAGMGFHNDASKCKVTFNGAEAIIHTTSMSELVVTVPDDATTGRVRVTIDGVPVDGPVFTVIDQVPIVSNLVPRAGAPGTLVTIAGAGFDAVAANNVVKFNGVEAVISQASASSLVVAVPDNATTGDVTVTRAGRSSAGMLFTVSEIALAVYTVAPMSGYVGSVVVVTGAGFGTDASKNVVTINGVAAQVTRASATQLTVVVGQATTTGPLRIEARGKSVTGPVFTIRPRVTVTTLVGNGSTAVLDSPYGIALNIFDDIFVANQNKNIIVCVNHVNYSVTRFAGGGGLKPPGDGLAADATFNKPTGIIYSDVTGDVWIADSESNAVRVIYTNERGDRRVNTRAGNLDGIPGYANGTGASRSGGAGAEFFLPLSIIHSKSDDVFYIVDNKTHIIRRMDSDANVTTFAGTAYSRGDVDGNRASALFAFPTAITIDAQNNLYVADGGNGKIRKIDPNGTVTTFASNVGVLYGITCDNEGNVYACGNQHKILKFGPSGNLSVIAGSTMGFADGDGDQARFDNPSGIAIARDGSIIVADRSNNRIRKISIQN